VPGDHQRILEELCSLKEIMKHAAKNAR